MAYVSPAHSNATVTSKRLPGTLTLGRHSGRESGGAYSTSSSVYGAHTRVAAGPAASPLEYAAVRYGGSGGGAAPAQLHRGGAATTSPGALPSTRTRGSSVGARGLLGGRASPAGPPPAAALAQSPVYSPPSARGFGSSGGDSVIIQSYTGPTRTLVSSSSNSSSSYAVATYDAAVATTASPSSSSSPTVRAYLSSYSPQGAAPAAPGFGAGRAAPPQQQPTSSSPHKPSPRSNHAGTIVRAPAGAGCGAAGTHATTAPEHAVAPAYGGGYSDVADRRISSSSSGVGGATSSTGHHHQQHAQPHAAQHHAPQGRVQHATAAVSPRHDAGALPPPRLNMAAVAAQQSAAPVDEGAAAASLSLARRPGVALPAGGEPSPAGSRSPLAIMQRALSRLFSSSTSASAAAAAPLPTTSQRMTSSQASHYLSGGGGGATDGAVALPSRLPLLQRDYSSSRLSTGGSSAASAAPTVDNRAARASSSASATSTSGRSRSVSGTSRVSSWRGGVAAAPTSSSPATAAGGGTATQLQLRHLSSSSGGGTSAGGHTSAPQTAAVSARAAASARPASGASSDYELPSSSAAVAVLRPDSPREPPPAAAEPVSARRRSGSRGPSAAGSSTSASSGRKSAAAAGGSRYDYDYGALAAAVPALDGDPTEASGDVGGAGAMPLSPPVVTAATTAAATPPPAARRRAGSGAPTTAADVGASPSSPAWHPSFHAPSSAASSPTHPGGIVGLANLGNTCYMNSLLQCLSNVPPLRAYFASGAYAGDVNPRSPSRGEVASALGRLLSEMWQPGPLEGPHRVVTPSDFKRVLSTSVGGTRFAGYAQHDAHEALRFLVEALCDDTNRVRAPPAYRELDAPPAQPDAAVSADWWAYYRQRNDSVPWALFTGQLKTSVTCASCGTVHRAFDPFQDLQLPLTGGGGGGGISSLLGLSGGGGEDGGALPLARCLRDFTASEALTGDNAYYCSVCRTHRDATKTMALFRLPRVLVLQLKRFSSSGWRRSKVGTPVSFPVRGLDVAPFCAAECEWRLVPAWWAGVGRGVSSFAPR